MKAIRNILIAFFCICTVPALAIDQHWNVKFDASSEDKQEKTFGSYRLIIEKTVMGSSAPAVSIKLNNRDSEQLLLVFDKEYTERNLKRHRPTKIYFDRRFLGQRGKRVTVACDESNKECLVDPGRTEHVLTITIPEGEKTNIQLPIYIAKYRNRHHSKITLLNLEKVFLEIEIEKSALKALQTRTDALLSKIQGESFCRCSATHRREQQSPYKKEIASLVEEIEKERKNAGLFLTDAAAEPYQDLTKRLHNVNLDDYKGYCSVHCGKSASTHSCAYCGKSLKNIKEAMDRLSMQVRTNRRSREDALAEAAVMYKCCTSGKHASEWQNSPYRQDIESFYDSIKRDR